MGEAFNDLKMEITMKDIIHDFLAGKTRRILYATAGAVLIYLIFLVSHT